MLFTPELHERRAGAAWDAGRVRDALASTKDFAGVTGSITMDADRNPTKLPVVLKVVNGRPTFAAKIE